ncbi:hypothetical protein CORC01_12443 [Colletotrichum orchidophilum]|uniref:Rhodopsin domain-containing protein n=1 Tax=Colletotrichum orchidophilum TaxID=1209926 RepID=A0A1G4ASY5_9PEZI|nr:uncharacterized protein CORC01_12443 [Colletotrichum orchidophilum]OHE92274.1 hypothetical protein CORC01_12443 [Colletotrichum orchidophilum]
MDDFPPEYANASNAGRIVGVVGVFHFLALAFVSLRIYARLVILRAFGAEDALIVAAAILALTSWVCLVLQIPYGLGHHASTLPTEDRIEFEHISFWKTVLSDGVAMGLLRISMAISLLRLKRDLRWYTWSLYAVIGFVVAYSVQAIVWLFVYCTPYSGWWEFQWMNPFDPRCHDFNLFINLTYWNVSCNIFTDICLGALPVPIIWHLKMKFRVRLYVIGILNLGYFAIIMGILKAVFMLTTGGDIDAIFDYWVHFWQNLQLNIGIIAACASYLKPLFGRLLKINSSIGYYPSNERYGRSGQTPLGAGTSSRGGNAYASGKRRTGSIPLDRSLHDEFEMHTKDGFSVTEQYVSGGTSDIGTRADAVRSPVALDGRSSAEAMYAGAVPSDANSEEIILQRENGRGIVCTRDFSVKYSENERFRPVGSSKSCQD